MDRAIMDFMLEYHLLVRNFIVMQALLSVLCVCQVASGSVLPFIEEKKVYIHLQQARWNIDEQTQTGLFCSQQYVELLHFF
jgi:hypothetical protein